MLATASSMLTSHAPPRPKPSAAPWVEKAKREMESMELLRVETEEANTSWSDFSQSEELVEVEVEIQPDSDLDSAFDEVVGEVEEDDNEKVIMETEATLKRLRMQMPEKVLMPGKTWTLAKVEVRELRYSQVSCNSKFRCGRSVLQLVQDLLDRKVSLSARFLTLIAYDDTDSKTGEPIIKCIDNRRLFALKEYAIASGDRVMVNINIWNRIDDVFHPITQKIFSNSDETDGHDVRFRVKRTHDDDDPPQKKSRRRPRNRRRNRQ